MNGNLTNLLTWVATGLVGLAATLVGFIVRLHMKSDDEHRTAMDQEILRLRDAMHSLRNSYSEIKSTLYMKDKK